MDSVGEETATSEEQKAGEATPLYTRKAKPSQTAATSDDVASGSPVQSTSGVLQAEQIAPQPPLAVRPRRVVPWEPSDHIAAPTPTTTQPQGKFDLPQPGAAADLAPSTLPARWVLLVFGLTLLSYWLFVNRIILYSSPPSGDQPFYLMVTMSIVQDGDFNIANNYANRDEDKFYSLAPHPSDFVGMQAPYPLPPHNGFTPARPATEQYNFHWPGLSLLVAPAWVIGGLFSLWWPATVVFMCIIGALLATNIFLLAHEMTGRVWIAVVVWAALVYSNPLMSYAYLIFSELTCGLLMLYAFRRLALGWGSNGPLRLLLIGLSTAYIPWVAWRCAPIAFGVALYAAVQWWRWTRTETRNMELGMRNDDAVEKVSMPSRFFIPQFWRSLRSTVWMLAPIVLSLALLAWYNFFLFGKFLPNNQTPERGDLPIFFWPWESRQNLTHFMTSGYGLLFDRIFGLLSFAPVYLLAAVGIIAMFQSQRRSDRRLLFWMGVIVLPYLGIIMSFYYWNGLWNPPARFQTTLVPLLAAPLALALFACSNWLFRVIYGVLAAWGLFMMGIMINDPRRLWPANAPYAWLASGTIDIPGAQVFPIKIDLWNILPAIDPLVQRTMPPGTAWVTIVSLAIVLVGYLLMLRWWRAQKTRKLPVLAQGATWAVAFVVAWASWYFANFDYIQHHTLLTEVGRIPAPGLQAARGMDYLDGKIYVADFQGGNVGVFDLSTNSYSLLQPTFDGAPFQLARPGDIKVGPDHNLYLLNNGQDNSAMLVMKPDGTIVNRIALNNKTPVAAGLQFGPDGKMYVADVSGGAILQYNPTGGDSLARYTGQTGGFNNVLGILVAQDGEIFAAENSNKRVQELKPGGDYVRSFQLDCPPYYMAGAGDWIDVACPGEGIVTLNRKTGSTQLSWTDPESAPALDSPSSMAYGPDGKLYVIDDSTLVIYTVQH